MTSQGSEARSTNAKRAVRVLSTEPVREHCTWPSAASHNAKAWIRRSPANIFAPSANIRRSRTSRVLQPPESTHDHRAHGCIYTCAWLMVPDRPLRLSCICQAGLSRPTEIWHQLSSSGESCARRCSRHCTRALHSCGSYSAYLMPRRPGEQLPAILSGEGALTVGQFSVLANLQACTMKRAITWSLRLRTRSSRMRRISGRLRSCAL